MAASVTGERTSLRIAEDDVDAGVSATGAAPTRRDRRANLARTDLLRIGLVCVVAGLVRFGRWDALGHPALVGLAATLVGGYPILADAVDDLSAAQVSMALVTLALVAALAIQEVFTALVITACVLATRALEAMAVSGGRRRAVRRRLTRSRRVRVRRDGLIDAVTRAERRRAPIQRTASRVAASLLSVAMAGAIATLVATRDVRAMIAVLIVAGTGGMTASTTLALRGAIRRAARSGATIESRVHLEALWSIDTAVLDQAGTVTFGDMRVTTVYPVTGVSVREVLEAAAMAECRSEHPIGRAIMTYAAEKRIPSRQSSGSTRIPGEGVRALDGAEEILVGTSRFVTAGRLPDLPRDDSGSTTVFVVRGGRYLGSIALATMPRPGAKQAMADLRALAIKTYLFTSDAATVTEGIARDLAVDDVETGLTPDAKRLRVQLLAKTRRVAIVGDGTHDAPARAAAAVGATPGSGTGVVGHGATIALAGNDLPTFVDTLRLARRTHAIIIQNIVGTVMVDGAGIALAAVGVVTPLMAAAIHVTTALAVILNSARLVPPR